MTRTLIVQTSSRGLFEITSDVEAVVRAAGPQAGLCSLFIQHSSASLLVQENADPTARADLMAWLDRLVPEHDPLYTHLTEGPDDMPAHIRAALLPTSLSIPVVEGRLGLGTWQGIYVWEHRRRSAKRRVLIDVR